MRIFGVSVVTIVLALLIYWAGYKRLIALPGAVA